METIKNYPFVYSKFMKKSKVQKSEFEKKLRENSKSVLLKKLGLYPAGSQTQESKDCLKESPAHYE